jgi:hypothetical protein
MYFQSLKLFLVSAFTKMITNFVNVKLKGSTIRNFPCQTLKIIKVSLVVMGY